ncbi:hypothetical protein L3Q82_024822 [Scortum barcoo]|uniref:Uncharacterized protein n=1 Tax=Scortum barcoo TaxID=214431 RepID=A0ACB8WPQ3_9TELE|nr:hypothetical protein L3Q82_024822 [Scortum barcoo]
MDQDCNTYQSELMLKGTDDFATKQEDFNPDDNQDEHPTTQNNSEASDYRHEDDHVCDSMKPQISNTERIDIAIDQVYEIKGQVEDDVKPMTEQTVDQEKEGIFSEVEERESSLQTLKSETKASLDSETQQTDTGFKPIGSRRKMGSSRRNKGRQQIKEPVTETYHEHKEVVESTMGNDTFETIQVSFTIERTSQEELSKESEQTIIMPETHDSPLYSAIMAGYFSEVQNPTTTNNPGTDLESFIPKSENIQEHHDERVTDFKVEVSEKSVVATLADIHKSDTLQCEEVIGVHHSEDAINKDHEEEVQPTEIQEIVYSSENVTHATTEVSEIISVNPMDQDKVSDTYKSELMLKGTDDFATKQEDFNPDDNQDKHPTTQSNFEASDSKQEDDHICDTRNPQIRNIEGIDIALDRAYEMKGQVENDVKSTTEQTVDQEKEGIFSEVEERESSLQTLKSETKASLDSEPQQTDTGFKPIGSRRKMGSSRRNKGRQQIKEPVTETYHEHKEVVESTMGNDTFETIQVSFTIERTSQEELSKESEQTFIMPETHDSPLYSAIMAGYSSEVQNPTTTNNPGTDLESFIPKSENIQERHDERVTDFKVEVSEKSVVATLADIHKSDTLQCEEVIGVHHSEDAINKNHEEEVQPTEIQEIVYSSENVTHATTEVSEIISVNPMDQDKVSDTYKSELMLKGTDDFATKQEDFNPDDNQDEHPTTQNNSEASDYRHEDDHVCDSMKPQISNTERIDIAIDQVYEIKGQQTDTGFKPIGSRRKMGSSRRNKGRQQIKEPVTETYHEHKEVVESTMGNDTFETTQVLFAIERMNEEESSQGYEQTMIMPETHDSPLYSAIMAGYSSEVQNPTTTNNPGTDLESFIPKSENIQEHHDERVTDFKVEVSEKSVVATLADIHKSDTLQCEEVIGVHHSEDAINKDHEEEVQPTEIQEIVYSSENVTHATTEVSEIISVNPMDQDKVSDTYKSELMLKGTDDFATKQEDFNPDDNQDKHPTTQSNFEASDSKQEDDHICDTRNPQIRNIEGIDIALDRAYEMKGQVENDVKSTTEQTVDQEKEGIFSEVEERESSLQTLKSETKASLDSEPQQTDTGFKPIGSRRKMGSSRRNKGRQQIKEPVTETYHEHKEVVESTMAIMAGYSSEVQNPTTTNNPGTDLESFIPKSENIQEHHDERVTDFKVEVSEKSVVATLADIHKSDTLQCEEVIGVHHSEDAINKDHEEEVQPTEIQEIVYSSENVTHATTEVSEIISVNPTDQDKVSDTYKSELMLKGTDDFATKQEDFNPDDNQDEHPTTQNNSEASDYRHEDDHVCDSMKPQISNTERIDIAIDQVYEIKGQVEDDVKPMTEQTVDQEKEGIFSEVEERESSLQTLKSETKASLDSEPQQTDTGFKPIGSRRKMGSSRRNKGRQQIKETVTETYHEHKEVVESTMAIMAGYSSEVQNPTTTNNPGTDLESFIPKSENIQEHHDERVTDFKVEVSEKSVVATLADIHKSDTLQCEEVIEVSEIISVNPMDQDKEDFNPDDNQDKHPTTQSNFEASDSKQEDDHICDTRNPQIRNIEGIDIALDRAYEMKGQVENDVKSTTEQTVDQEKEGIFSEVEERESSLQTLKSETKASLDSEPQQTDTGFKPIGSRRKMGSSRRNKGRQQIKEPVTETYHEHKEVVERQEEGIFSEVEERESSLQTLKSETKASLDSEPQQTDTGFKPIGSRRKMGSSRRNKGRQQIKETVTETYHEHKEVVESTMGNDTFETTQVLFAIERMNEEESSQGYEQTMIMPETHDSPLYSAIMAGYSSEVQNPTTTNNPGTDLESFIPRSENIQEHHDERVTDFKVEVSEKSVVATLADIHKSDTLQCEEVIGVHHSEDAINKDHEEEVQPTEIQEIVYSSENVTHATTEVSEIISVNPMDQDKVSDTYKSELMLKGTDDFATKQEDFNPDDNQDKHPTKQSNFEASDSKQEDDHICDTRNPQIRNIEGIDIALDRAYEMKGQVENDVKSTTEQTVDQEKEGIFSEVEERESSLQTLKSETKASLDSEPQQTDTGFKPIGSRRKMGSSRRNKGRQQIKEPVTETYHEHKEVVESTMGNDTFETIQVSFTIERTSQEELSKESEQTIIMPETHDSPLYSAIMAGYSSEVQNPTTTNNPGTDLESFIPKSENIQEHHDERVTDFKVEVSEKSVVATLADIHKSDTLQCEEVIGVHHSEDAINKDHEEEVQPTEIQEIVYSSENVTHATTEVSEIISVNPMDQDEVSDTYKSELMLKGTDDFATKQEDFNPDDNQDEHPTTQNNSEASDYRHEDDHVCDSMKPQISNTERIDIAIDQVYEIKGQVKDDVKPMTEQTVDQEKEGIFSEVEERESSLQTLKSETKASLDSEPQQTDTGFKPIGSRRKLGSSRRNKGRQNAKDSVAESYHRSTVEFVGNTRDKEPFETMKMSLTIETAEQKKSMETTLEGMDISDNHQTEICDQVKENAHTRTLAGISAVHTEIDCSIVQAPFSSSKEESSTNKQQEEHVDLSQVRGTQHSKDAVSEVHEEEIRPTHMQDIDQCDLPSVTESGFSLSRLQSEMNASLDPQHQDDSQSMRLQSHTGFNPSSRRKMGSSRRNKGRQQVKDSFSETLYEPKEELEAFGTTKMSLATETQRQEELKDQTTLYPRPAERTRKIRSTVNDEENTEKIPEDTILSQNVMDNNTVVTTEISSSLAKDDFIKSNKDINEEEEKLTVKMDLIKSPEVSVLKDYSDIQNITYDDGNVNVTPSEVQVSGQDEVVEEFGDLQFSAADNKMETLEHIGLEKNFEAESAEDVPEKSGISSQLGIQEKTHLDDSENLQGNPKQKRRKMGSTRRTQLSRKTEGEMDNKDETKDKLPKILTAELSDSEDQKQETNDTSAVHDKGQKLQSNTVDVVNLKFAQVVHVRDGERNVGVSLEPFDLDDFTSTEMHVQSVLAGRNSGSVSLLQSSADTEDASNTGGTCETTQKTQNYGEKPESIYTIQDQALKSAEVPVAAVADLEIVKYVDRGGGEEEHKDAQTRTEEPNNANGGACNQNLEMESASPNLNLTSRRRKMGSTRRNLRSRTEGEHYEKQEVDNKEAETTTNVEYVKVVSFSDIQERELHQLKDKESEPEHRKEKVFETMEYSHIGESHFKPPAHQTFEENPVPHGEQVQSDHQPTPSYLPVIPSTSPKHDVMSESASSGKRRKMGSHRKSRGDQNNENRSATGNRITDTQNGRDIQSIPDESAIKTTGEESLSLDKISEVDESDKKASSSISTSKAGQHTSPESEKIPERVTPVQPHYSEIRLSQESQRTLSLGNPREVDLRSSRYNVVMVGDSSVGKTSFMKRAQSGKFSLDLPASVGLDSCVWTVAVDAKPVVLQLWDTAGQERFHSITRQILHKAQAFLLMYDITSSHSFSAVSYWANCIQEGAAENVTIVLLGNKSDHAERRVKTQDGEILAKEYNFEFMECSAATGENVVHCLETVARLLSQRADTREEALVLKREPQKKKSSGCC